MEENDHAKHILVGEDDVFLSNVYKTKLAKEGFDVTHAVNGDEVMKFAREKTPDIILLDLMMPIKDGFETLKELKADQNLKNVKVIVLSNLSQEEDRQRVINLGAEDYVVKADVSFREIIDMVKKHLKG